jgi:ribonuclease VapC
VAVFDHPPVIRVGRNARSHLSGAVISAVNLAEVESTLADCGLSDAEIRGAVDPLALDVLPFDGEMARRAGLLQPATGRVGLSLGDRACLASALVTGLQVLTADRKWASLDVGVSIKAIR